MHAEVYRTNGAHGPFAEKKQASTVFLCLLVNPFQVFRALANSALGRKVLNTSVCLSRLSLLLLAVTSAQNSLLYNAMEKILFFCHFHLLPLFSLGWVFYTHLQNFYVVLMS